MNQPDRIKIALIGIGNCASSLLQGMEHYRRLLPEPGICPGGLMHWDLGGYRPGDIEVVAAWDIDARKVGRDVAEAIFAPPNCTTVFEPDVPAAGVTVRMGRILDGVSDHMADHRPERTFVPADAPQPEPEDVIAELKRSGARIVVNYLPVGSQQAVEFYARAALEAGCALVNNMPVFIASNPTWAERFTKAGLPIIGDDIKSQLGATIVHRILSRLFAERGVDLKRTYQLNTGGNTDFLNMLNHHRLASKKISKTEAVQSVCAERLAEDDIHVGPSDYVAWQNDNKICFLRLEGELFGGVPMNLELRLSVEDSPNSAGVAIDAIRCAQLGLDRGVAGPLTSPSSFFMKHPPQQFPDATALTRTEEFIEGKRER